jgi:hypothetical protein
MSYTFNNTGGTNYGVKTYNEIFAINRKTVGASNYWNPTLVSGDTVVCEMSYVHASQSIKDYKLLTWYDFDQGGSLVYGSHWIGAGIYLCYDSDGNGWGVGDFLCCPLIEDLPGAAGARPLVVKATSVAEAERPMGVALEPCDEGGELAFATVAMMGLWPMKRQGTLGRSEAIYSRTDGSGKVDDAPIGSYKNGAFGKAIDPDFPIITSTAATPTTVDGAQVCMWGTAAEVF